MVAYLKTQSVLELLNHFSNLSTVAYKEVAYKKTIVYLIYTLILVKTYPSNVTGRKGAKEEGAAESLEQ